MLSFKDLINSTSSTTQEETSTPDIRNDIRNRDHQVPTSSMPLFHHHNIMEGNSLNQSSAIPSTQLLFETSRNDEKVNLPSINTLLNTRPPSPTHLYSNQIISSNLSNSSRPNHQQHYSIPNQNNNGIHQHTNQHYQPQPHDIQMQRSYSISSVQVSNKPPSYYPQSYSKYTDSQQPPQHHSMLPRVSPEGGYYQNQVSNNSAKVDRNAEYGQSMWPVVSPSNNGQGYTNWQTPKAVSPPPSNKVYPNHSRETRLINTIAPSHNEYQHQHHHQHTTYNPPTPFHRDSIPPPHSYQPNNHITSNAMVGNSHRVNTTSSNNNNSRNIETNQPSILSTLNNQPNFQSNSLSQPTLDDEEIYDETIGASGSYRFRKGWTKDEHIRFLIGVHLFGRGNWKNISKVISGKSPKQVQSHAQKYFLRQEQTSKTKRSIHDFNLEDLIELLKDVSYRNAIREDVSQKGRELEELINRFENSYKEKNISGETSHSGSSGNSQSPSTPPTQNSQRVGVDGKQLVTIRNKPTRNKPY